LGFPQEVFMLQKRFIANWRAAAESKDLDAIEKLFADKAELISPIAFEPIREHAKMRAIFAAIIEVLPDFSYTRCEGTETGAIMLFRGKIGGTGLEVEGVDVFTLGLDGSIYELKVFVRPLKAAIAFAEAMAVKLGLSMGTE
jgi:hypothetical protein